MTNKEKEDNFKRIEELESNYEKIKNDEELLLELFKLKNKMINQHIIK